MPEAGKTFRVFVSSTFSDLKAERDALQQYVFPKLRELCMQHGCRFQAIDLRWGVSEEASRDQQAVKICLEEVKRCQRVTPRPNFIVLLGDRYGWQPLPAEMPGDEFEQILLRVTNMEDKALLLWDYQQSDESKGWYRRDDNAVPAVYCLQPRTGDFADYARWQVVERRLHSVLLQATAGIALPPGDRVKYTASATEQEIVRGALDVHDAHEHVFCFFRRFANFDDLIIDSENENAKNFIDVGEDLEPDQKAFTLQAELKQRLRDSLPDNNHDYEADWSGDGISTDHLGRLPETLEDCLRLIEDDSVTSSLCVDVWRRLARVILDEIARLEKTEALEKEITDHGSFGENRARSFIGRASILKTILDYVAREDRHPLAVWGESGSGKSALMAKAISACGSCVADAAIVSRFIGATPASSDARSLLESICRQITRSYGGDEATIPADYKDLIKELPQRLALAKSDKPLVVFVDALDQLSDSDHARNLIWLPRELPEHVRLVVSTLPGECKSALERKLPSTNLMKLEPMPGEEGSELLEIWLKEAGRTLQRPQRDEVLRKFAASGRPADVSSDTRAEGGMPLYLKLAFEEARRWRSYSPLVDLDGDILSVIRQLFERLSLDANHGKLMVERSLGYLAAAKNGLTEDELLDVLSRDEEVLGDFKIRAKHTPPEEHLPVIVWSRLYFDLEPYLTERTGDGASLLSFYHRQLGEAVAGNYLVGDEKRERHRRLADYFAEQLLQVEKDGERTPNLRKVSELPFQQTLGEMWEELEGTLCDLGFIEAKCSAEMTYDLVADYQSGLAAANGQTGWPGINRVLEFSRFVQGQAHILRSHPTLTFQQAANQPDISMVAETAKKLWQRGIERRAWLEWVNKPRHCDPCIMTLTGHSRAVRACAYSTDGKRIVSASEDSTLKIWDAESGAELATLAGHWEWVTACVYSPDGRRIVSASGRTLKIWDAESGVKLATLTGHSSFANACAYSPDGRRIVSASGDSTLKIWDAESGAELATLAGHSNAVTACAYSPDGRRIVSASEDSTLKIWNAESGAELATLVGHSDMVGACAYSPDGRRIVSASRYRPVTGLNRYRGTLKIWDAESGVGLASLVGHSDQVNACAYSPDGRRIVSASMDSTLKIWDADSGVELATGAGHSSGVYTCGYSPDGRRIVSASRDKTLKIWDAELILSDGPELKRAIAAKALERFKKRIREIMRRAKSGVELATPTGHSSFVKACAYSPDGRHIVSASGDSTLKIWDAESGAELATLTGHSFTLLRRLEIEVKLAELATLTGSRTVNACAYSPDGGRIVSASMDHTLKIWDAESGAELATLAGHSNEVTACAYSPDGRRIVSASGDHTLKIWDAESGTDVATLAGHSHGVSSCAYSPDGRRIVSASVDSTLKIWDAGSGAELATLVHSREVYSRALYTCAYSPDGRRIVSTSGDHTPKIWDAELGVELATLVGHADNVIACTYSPDGRRIVSASVDSTLKIWDAESGVELATWGVPPATWDVAPLDRPGGYWGEMGACAYSPDGRRIVSASKNTLNVWDSQAKDQLVYFLASHYITALAVGKAGYYIGAGDEIGRMYLLRLVNLDLEPPLVTRAHIYQPERRDWDEQPTAKCEWCGKRFTPPPIVISSIHSISQNANLSSDQSCSRGVSPKSDGRSKTSIHESPSISPCTALPPEAWDDPRLLSECPSCHQPLRFNPFIVDNRERY
jgi:WD40 repeat protein